MKSTSLLFLLAALPVRAFTNLPLSTQSSLIVTKDGGKNRRQNVVKSKPSTSAGGTLSAKRALQQSSSTMLQSSTASSDDASSSVSAELKAQLTLLWRSSFCALSTVVTWAMVQHAGMTIVQASALQGLAGCLLLPKPYAMAWFCGSFAGMSAQPAALDEASLLAAACTAVFYQFERNQLALGRGGRLGLIAFLSNLMYFAIRKGPQATAGIALDVVNAVRPITAVTVAVGSAILTALRMRAFRTFAKASPPLKHRFVKLSTQSVMLVVLLNRLVASGGSVLGFLTTFMATLVPSLMAWTSKYTIFPVALLGALAGFVTPSLAPAVYLGGFIGMCSLPQFGITKFVRAAALSAVLLQLGLLGGFGGRLGFWPMLASTLPCR